MQPGHPPVERVPVAATTPTSTANHGQDLIRNLDLLVLLLALPVFILADLPISGYLAAGGAWLVGRVGVDAGRQAPLRRPCGTATAAPRSGSPRSR